MFRQRHNPFSPVLFFCSTPTSFPQALTSLNPGAGPMDKILGHKKPSSLRKKVKNIRYTPEQPDNDNNNNNNIRIDPATDFHNSMITKEEVQVVHAMASAEAYDLNEVYKFLPSQSCEVIGNEVIRYSSNNQNWFIFKYGTFVGWGVSEVDVGNLRDSLKTFAVNPSRYQEFEQLDYVVTAATDESLFLSRGNGMIVIGGQGQSSVNFDQLAFSHGIANSVKLAILETELEHFITQIKDLPEMLSSQQRYKSKFSFNRKDALNRLSSLLKFRAHLNLHSGLLETPDLYWDDSQLESHFHSISEELDIKSRVSTLNKKMDYAKDIAELLKEYLTERHSLNLEWCIIILIAIEVVFGLPQFFREYNLSFPWL